MTELTLVFEDMDGNYIHVNSLEEFENNLIDLDSLYNSKKLEIVQLGFDNGEYQLKEKDIEYLCGLELGTILELLENFYSLDFQQTQLAVAMSEYNCNSIFENDEYEFQDNHCVYYDIDDYYNDMDQLIEDELESCSDLIAPYFDWDQYHRDLSFEVYECSNGVVICY